MRALHLLRGLRRHLHPRRPYSKPLGPLRGLLAQRLARKAVLGLITLMLASIQFR